MRLDRCGHCERDASLSFHYRCKLTNCRPQHRLILLRVFLSGEVNLRSCWQQAMLDWVETEGLAGKDFVPPANPDLEGEDRGTCSESHLFCTTQSWLSR